MSAEESVDEQFDACDSPLTAAADTPRRGATSDSNAAHAPQEFGSVRESERGSGSCDGMRPSFAQADARALLRQEASTRPARGSQSSVAAEADSSGHREPLCHRQSHPPSPRPTPVQNLPAQIVGEDPTKLEGLVTWTVKRVIGRMKRAERRGRRGELMRYGKMRNQLLRCIGSLHTATAAERQKMLEDFSNEGSLEDSDESPSGNYGYYECIQGGHV